MSTTRTSTTTSQYDPSSMGTFRGFQGQIGAGLTDYAQDPMKATYFNRQVQMMNLQNAGYANQANQQLMMNQRAMGGMSNPNAFMASQLARNQRAAQARSSQGFNQLLMGANQVRMQALGQMQGYRPLQIGQTSKESTGGLGSWLSPLISAGVGAFTGSMFNRQSSPGSTYPGASYMPGDYSNQPTGNLPIQSAGMNALLR
jgi:hypothetical protein